MAGRLTGALRQGADGQRRIQRLVRFNGLLRQYIRKGTDLRTVTDKQIGEIKPTLNARPRKCLGFRQPVAVFNELSKTAVN